MHNYHKIHKKKPTREVVGAIARHVIEALSGAGIEINNEHRAAALDSAIAKLNESKPESKHECKQEAEQ